MLPSIDIINYSIGIIGAGFSGLCAGIQIQKQLGIQDFTIFDQNSEVGGTWLVNTYPNCCCDVVSHLYSLSFEPNPRWSEFYSPQPEILEYAKSIAKKYNLYKNIKFRHEVKRATWIQDLQQWEILVKNKDTGEERIETFDLLIVGVGGLRSPNIPKEFLAFKESNRMHSGKWNSDIKLDGKIVGIVGSGASSIQIIPSIAQKVKELKVFQRRPAWVIRRTQFKFPTWIQRAFESVPGLQLAFRASLFWLYEMSHNIYISNSYTNALGSLVTKLAVKHINSKFGDDTKMIQKLKPNYAIGCKRIAPSSEYYPSLKLPNVTVSTSPIKHVSSNSIQTEDGLETKLDVLILATGFKVQDFASPMEIYGKDGVNIMELWKKEGPSTYQGISTHHMPNCFFLIGPNSTPGNTSALFSMECQVNWTMQVIQELIRKKCKQVRVKEWAEKAHMDKLHENMKRTVWSQDCGSWYVDHRGIVTALNPVSGLSYWMQIRKPDYNKLSFE